MIDLRQIYSNEFLSVFAPAAWKSHSPDEKERILNSTKNEILKKLNVPVNDLCPILHDTQLTSNTPFKTSRQNDGSHVIKVNNDFIFNGTVDGAKESKRYGPINDISAIVAFSGIIHECIHVSQDYVTNDGSDRYRKLNDNSLNRTIKFLYGGKLYPGSLYLSVDLSSLIMESREIARHIYQLQYREREAFEYTEKAVDLMLNYLSLKHPGYDQAGLRNYCKELTDLRYSKKVLHDHFGCRGIETHIDNTLHYLNSGFIEKIRLRRKIPEKILDTIKCLSALTYDPTNEITCDAIKKMN